MNQHNITTVLEPSGIPVTGTPSISFISYFIIYRWTLYKKSIIEIDGEPRCYLFNKVDGVPVTGIVVLCNQVGYGTCAAVH